MWADTTETQYVRADLAAKRFDRCRMGAARAILSAALACGAAAQVVVQADCRGNPASVAWRQLVADASAVFAAGLDGAALVLSLAGQQTMVVVEPYPAADRTRSCRPPGLTQCWPDRQPERQSHGKRRVTGL